MSIRSLFLFIRGIDQTGKAIRGTISNMDALQKKQLELQQSSFRLMFAGAAFTAFGALMGKALLGTISHSQRGSVMLNRLGNSFMRFQRALGNKILDRYSNSFENLIDKLYDLSKNEKLLELLSRGLDFAIAISIVGVGMMIGGLVSMVATTIIGALGLGAGATAFAAGLPGIATLAAIVIGTAIILDVLDIKIFDNVESTDNAFDDIIKNRWDNDIIHKSLTDLMYGTESSDPFNPTGTTTSTEPQGDTNGQQAPTPTDSPINFNIHVDGVYPSNTMTDDADDLGAGVIQ